MKDVILEKNESKNEKEKLKLKDLVKEGLKLTASEPAIILGMIGSSLSIII